MNTCPDETTPRKALVPKPRKALRGVISNVNFNQVCQLLTTISHKMAPRTRKSEAGINPRRAFCGQTRVCQKWQGGFQPDRIFIREQRADLHYAHLLESAWGWLPPDFLGFGLRMEWNGAHPDNQLTVWEHLANVFSRCVKAPKKKTEFQAST